MDAMKYIEAVFEDGAFWPRSPIGLESGSSVQLELKRVHPPPTENGEEAKWSWDSQSLSDLEATVLQAVGESVRALNLEEIERRLNRIMNVTERATVEREEVKQVVCNMLKSGYMEASFAPATLQGYQITAMGKVCAILSHREEIRSRRKARGLTPKSQNDLPIPEVFVQTFQELDIAFLELGRRTSNILKSNGIVNVGALCQMTLKELCQIDKVGPESIDNIVFKLGGMGLELRSESGEV